MKKLIFNIIRILTYSKWSLYGYFGFLFPIILNILTPSPHIWWLNLGKGILFSAIFVYIYYLLFKKEIKLKNNHFFYKDLKFIICIKTNGNYNSKINLELTIIHNNGVFTIKKVYISYLNLAMSLGYINYFKIKNEEFVNLYALFTKEIEYYNMHHSEIDRKIKVVSRKEKIKKLNLNETI